MSGGLDRLLTEVARAIERSGARPFVVGITGGVAVGKSTVAEQLAGALHADAVILPTDAFLLPNAVLDARGLSMRKGWPETHDLERLEATIVAIRARTAPVVVPVYSHAVYDVVGERMLEPADVVILEGLVALRVTVDFGVYLHAEEATLIDWYCDRFAALCSEGRDDPASFFHRFGDLDAEEARAVGRAVWDAVNGPNVREHVVPLRSVADFVIDAASLR